MTLGICGGDLGFESLRFGVLDGVPFLQKMISKFSIDRVRLMKSSKGRGCLIYRFIIRKNTFLSL